MSAHPTEGSAPRSGYEDGQFWPSEAFDRLGTLKQVPEAAVTPSQLERSLRFERALARIRWFGIVLGVYEVLNPTPIAGNAPTPGWSRPLAFGALGLLGITNIFVAIALRTRPGAVQRASGTIVFGADILALWTMTWAYNHERFGVTWILLVILCLEGAHRYQLRGALLPVALAVPIETARVAFNHSVNGFPWDIPGIVFRIGFMGIIGSVAGFMARDMVRERMQAEKRAGMLEVLAGSEAAARRESNAFQEVILAGVSAADIHSALRSMLEHIASDLGYDRSAVLMRSDDGRLRPVAARGFSTEVFAESVGEGEGLAGSVFRTGKTELLTNVDDDPRYHCVDPTTRSQITVPIMVGENAVGVLDVESDRLAAFDEHDASRLERLSTQMALVIEQARLLAQERAAVERLRELDQMKSDFVAIASHELRTPLTAMRGSIKTLGRPDGQLTAAQRHELLAMLDRQSDRLTRLIEDLLIASRIDAGEVSLRLERCDMNDLFAEMFAELGASAERVSLAVPPSLPPIVTDGQRVGQIARNLVENALKFSPGETTVRVSVHSDATTLTIDVSDDGPGIPEAELPLIFERFHQVGGALRRRHEGFGLGLYITKRLVEALGGTIEVESGHGSGTTFRVRVPVTHTARPKAESA